MPSRCQSESVVVMRPRRESSDTCSLSTPMHIVFYIETYSLRRRQMRTDRLIELIQTSGQSPGAESSQMAIISVCQVACRHGLEKRSALVLALDSPAENRRDNGLAHVGIGAVDLQGAQRVVEGHVVYREEVKLYGGIAEVLYR